ncbi:PcfJ domain-containing protein [Streptomyces sp. MMS24-I29]|uniref:PcfJ domain-containing protein n=1 Tax=Streptomyces sp. MMS24-I29 TaxID=3351480 RepID=UPI003C7DD71A
MSESSERVLLHVKFLNDRFEPTTEGVCTGSSLRVVARTAPGGRVSASGSVSYRVHRTRASGKVFRYWQTQQAFSLLRTKAGLVVLRVLERSSRKNSTQHLFAGGERQLEGLLSRFGTQILLDPMDHHTWNPQPETIRVVEGPEFPDFDARMIQAQMIPVLRDLQSEILRLIGDLPVAEDRFPLLETVSFLGLAHSGQMYYLDAEDFKTVAENVFGKTRYRKPLAREIERLTQCMKSNQDWRRSHDMSVLNWFRMFRGLVPVDWIIESMRRTETNHYIYLTPAELVMARALFRRVPQPVLGRILAEPVAQAVRVIKDTVRTIGNPQVRLCDLDLLPELIRARGQRRIRSSRDLENLVRSMPTIHVESPSLVRSNQMIGIMINEAHELQAMDRYNRQIARLEDRDLPVATWEQWKLPEFREDAEELLAEHRHELMTAQEAERQARAEKRRQERLALEQARAAWAAETTKKLDGVCAGGYRFVVARDAETLARWGWRLNNCIAGYASELGLDVFVGVLDGEDRVRLNIEIDWQRGICQFLGTNNRDAVAELGQDAAQQVLDAVIGTGIPVDDYALGMYQLSLPEQSAVTA